MEKPSTNRNSGKRNLSGKQKFLILIFLLAVAIPSIVIAQSVQNYTVTTYHPSPSGSYDKIRFFRQDASIFSQACQPGTFAVDQNGDLRFCGADTQWSTPDQVWDKNIAANSVFLHDWANPDAFVGIGTSVPQAKLHISKNDPAVLLQTSGTGDNNRLNIATDGSTNVHIYTGNNVDLRLGVTSPAQDIVIKSSGNVGIGTTNPTDLLHVNGNIIANDPTVSTHLVTKNYADQGPTLESRAVSSASCANGGVDGVDIRIAHAGNFSSWTRVSEPYCYPAPPTAGVEPVPCVWTCTDPEMGCSYQCPDGSCTQVCDGEGVCWNYCPGPSVHSLLVMLVDKKEPKNSKTFRDIHTREIEARTTIFLGDGLFLSINSWGKEPLKIQDSPFKANAQVSTPFLFTHTGESYVIENDVMSTYFGSNHEMTKELYENNAGDRQSLKQTGYYKLRLNPAVTEEGVKLLIKEIYLEESFIDEARLRRIIHPKGSELSIDHDTDQIHVAAETRLERLKSCEFNNSADCLGDISQIDDKYLEGEAGDEMIFEIDITGLKKSDLKDIEGDSLQVKITWTARHFIDEIALIQTQPVKFTEEELKLNNAVHSNGENVTTQLLSKDYQYAHTIPEDTVNLVFDKPKHSLEENQMESYVFVASGFYTGLRYYLYPEIDLDKDVGADIKQHVEKLEEIIQKKLNFD